ncbi:hypothetical protein E2C01_009497 [Portunus trituberculatus]|uniref:Uncharacterized protein n=1 Tax=Portunus trituberculatus TaxID=210409 RepID=A0A5B7D5Y5_PORTR|nr:hypothetical protein [Portunus trituberculatus]
MFRSLEYSLTALHPSFSPPFCLGQRLRFVPSEHVKENGIVIGIQFALDVEDACGYALVLIDSGLR